MLTFLYTTVASSLAKRRDKDRCGRLNLIVHQLTEPTETDVKKECDIKETVDIIQNYLGVSATVNNAVKLGSKVLAKS